jgi:acyl transferase domain-containing protein/acyl carrier protein/NAD(P)-dependent dehydrogenase (short-subunit alcohol dehydrogenase family)
VGAGAVLPDAPNVAAFWANVKNGRYSISEVTTDRWDPAHHYDPDPSAPDKTYSKIGGWVREHPWDPIKWRLPIPPRVASAMDIAQQWGIACTREALEDYGYPTRPLNPERTAVILGNAMAGEMHYLTAFRVQFPVFARELGEAPSFAVLPEPVRRAIIGQLHERICRRLPTITEDSMPGELANCIAGRIANLYNFHGPNYVADAACASAMAAITGAVEGLVANQFDMAITGGIDRNMGASTFVKFCKIGALSATGTRPFADGADGFVMGEGAVVFVLKRLADAERDGDKIYAVLRGIAGASDGKGKGITAPNPIGQKLAIERAWQTAGLSPASATLIEGHGTSTRVGDAVEVESLMQVLGGLQLPTGSVALGSVKSNIGHLKGAASAAGLLKTALALREKVLPPSVNCERPNPNIDFVHSPLYVNTQLKPWTVAADGVRRAGLSAFGFGGTNFHAVLEEYIPHKLTGGNGKGRRSIAVEATSPAATNSEIMNPADGGAMNNLYSNKDVEKEVSHPTPAEASPKLPLRGALVVGAVSEAALTERLRSLQQEAAAGRAPALAAPARSDLRAPERLAIDYADAAELGDKAGKALKALAANQPAIWKALRAQGIFRGHGPVPKVAFLYTGQGSQYVNMLKALRAAEPVIAETFAEADRVMVPLIGKPLTDIIFVDSANAEAVAKAEEDLRQTAITQPAVISTDIAMTRLLAAYGVQPDMTMGHSVGEYGALCASGALPFEDALEAVSARGREMTRVSMADNGKMAAVFAPLSEIERLLKTIDGYVVIANLNSLSQAVIGGATKAVEQAVEVFLKAGYNAVPLPVSHAFHTSIVAPASEPLRRMLERLRLQSPTLPIVANVDGEFYPTGPDVKPRMLDMLAKQVAAPVQFVKGLHKLYEAGTRVFVEMGPKKALHGFVEDVFSAAGNVLALFTNHPKVEDLTAFNQALCGLYSAGLGRGAAEAQAEVAVQSATAEISRAIPAEPAKPMPEMPVYAVGSEPTPLSVSGGAPTEAAASLTEEQYAALGRVFAEALERGREITRSASAPPPSRPVVVTGAALGLPGTERIFDDSNVSRILRGDQFIDAIPTRFRRAILGKNITRLVKSDNGGAFESITNVADVIKLAARGGAFDLEKEFGISSERNAALDRVTRLAIGAGLDALRDAGIPLVLHYKTTSKGTQLPNRWALPEALRDDTGVIFASAFPGYDSLVEDLTRYHGDRANHAQLAVLENLRSRAVNGHAGLGQELDRLIGELQHTIEKEPYAFDRRFMFRVLPMGHSQFAELIGARGPNTHINAACASTTQGIALAEDWIRAGRCRRVVVLSADDITSDNLMEWWGAAFLATGAAATGEVVEETALPFDRRRNGMLLGMGAAALVVESADAVRERGLQPICEVLGAVTANSAFHGTRLDVEHIGQVMETLVAQAESRGGIVRRQIASQTVFVSHETYTPARGGSASAEIHALRQVFGEGADRIVITNTKGFTGHAMGAGIEDVVAVKALETGCVPPVANFKEVDPELGELNLSKGGLYPVEYALRLGAGFGSQISMTLMRWIKTKDGVRPYADALGYSYRVADEAAWKNWLGRMSGSPEAELEVVQRTLRVRDQKHPARIAEAAPELQPRPARVVEAPRVVPMRVAQETATVGAIAVAVARSPLPVEQPAKPSPVLIPAPPVEVQRPQETKPVVCAAPVVEAPAKAPAEAKPQYKPAAVAPQGAEIKDRILALVVDKTGYPKEMLDLDLDLEADLGVDTVKQAEMLAAIREIYDIPRDANLKLRDFPTLAHVIQFVYSKRPDLAGAPAVVLKEEIPVAAPAPIAAEPARPTETKAAVVAPTPAPGAEDVKERILALVVEKTGYPKDMLDLELDLEADLGVDTVKQAEMFAAIREIYNIPRDANLKLRDFPTLAHVIQFVYNKRPDLAGASVAPAAAAKAEVRPAPAVQPVATSVPAESVKVVAAVAPAAAASADVKERILALVVEKTGYPKDMLDLELDLEADLGVDTVKQAEMFAAIREIYNIPRDANLKLRDFPTLAHVIQFVYDKRPDLAGAPAAAAKAEVQSAPVQVTPEAAPVAEAKAVVTAPAAAASADVKERILALVVEKTGYPKDMLDLELDLEADLGVDTVKQAEMFAAIREIYNIPRDANLKLRDFPTLAHVIQFVYNKRPDLAGAPAAAAKAEVQPAPAVQPVAAAVPAEEVKVVAAVAPAGAADVKERILTLVVEKTGYPKDMLDLELDLEADLGVDTVKQAEMFAAIREIYNIPRDANLKLRDFPTLAHVIQFVYDKRPDLAGVPAVASAQAAAAELKSSEPVQAARNAQEETQVAAAPAETEDDEAIKERILALVVEKTGYPKDMLDLELDLEADLGIDTVKQAEMFAAIREIYNIPRDANLKLRDFPTLAHVIRFARERRPAKSQPAGSKPAAAPAASAPVAAVRPRPPLASLDAANAIPRRVPVPSLRPPLAVCKPTGVTLSRGQRVIVMPDQGGVGQELSQRLQNMGLEVLLVEGVSDAEALEKRLKQWLAAGPVQGVYWLSALDKEAPIAEMDFAAWRQAMWARLKALYTTMRALYEQVAAPGTFLVSATRLGGQHGYDQAGAFAPMGGAVVGFTKAYKRERMDALVKAVDFEPQCAAAQVAELLISETQRDPGAVEIGYQGGERWTIGLQERPAADGQPGLTLDQNTVFVVTGAAGGIVSAITSDLAAASGGTFYLLDLVPEPDPENPDLKRFVNDKDGLKRELFARIQARGERATPALVERELAALERAQAACSAIKAVRTAGGTPHYCSVNLTDPEAVAKVIGQVRERNGRIDVLLHAAGMERSHFLPDKDQREFNLVFDVKSDGWFNLLRAIGDMPLGATVAFSSIAGRFGNGGQADYSSANDLLCKFTSSFRTTRPATRGIAIDWTAWGGIGMATRGSIPKMMELAGIDMLPPEAGVPLIRRELTAGGTRGEIVVGQRLGILIKEWDETGGLDPSLASGEGLAKQGPMVGKIASMGLHSGLTIETTLDPKVQPFLHDHQIDSTPVLPGVMGIEAFAEAALSMLPGWRVEAIENVNFLAPFKFYRNEPRTVTVQATLCAQAEGLIADCRLTGSRQLPNQPAPQVTTHFTARVHLTKEGVEPAKILAPGATAVSSIPATDIYRYYFHGPAYQVLERAWCDGQRIVGQLAKRLPDNHRPAERPILMAPRLIELCFQTAGLWEMGVKSRMGLPHQIHQVSVWRAPELAEGPLYAVVTPSPEGTSFDADVVDAAGNRYVYLSGYCTVALPNSVDAEPLKALGVAA